MFCLALAVGKSGNSMRLARPADRGVLQMVGVFTSRKHAALQQPAAWGLLCFHQNKQPNSHTKHSHRCWRSPCLLANSHYFVTLFSGGGRKQRLSESRRQTDVKWKVRAKRQVKQAVVVLKGMTCAIFTASPLTCWEFMCVCWSLISIHKLH